MNAFLRCLVSALLLAFLSTEIRSQSVDQFLAALGQVESGNNDAAVGDGGAALGRYQIHQSYWQDAVDHDPSIGGSYGDVVNPDYAKKIVLAYLDRYAPKALKAGNWETCARLHNGGPRVVKKPVPRKLWRATTKYWQRIKLALGV